MSTGYFLRGFELVLAKYARKTECPFLSDPKNTKQFIFNSEVGLLLISSSDFVDFSIWLGENIDFAGSLSSQPKINPIGSRKLF